MEEKSKIPAEYAFGIKLLIVLYAITPFIPRLETVDPIGSQWLYVGILNMASLFLVYKVSSKGWSRLILGRHLFMYVFVAFILVASLSLFTAINSAEGWRVLTRIVTIFIAVVSLYYLFQVNFKEFFRWLTKVLIIIAFLIGLQVVFNFIGNWSVPRLKSLVEGTRLLFGTRNVTSATLAILLPFNLLGIVLLNKKWRYFTFLSTFLTVTAILYIGSRTALLSCGLVLLMFVFYCLFDKSYGETLSRKLKTIVLPILVIVFVGFTLVLNSNRLYKGQANTFLDIINTSESYSDLKKNRPTKNSLRSNARIDFYTMSKDDIISNPLLGVGLGNWKLSNKDLYYKNFNKDKYVYPARAHNDFLQITAETGLLGGVLYLFLFVFLGYLLMKAMVRSQEKEDKWMYFALFCAFVAYSLDASLNFPLERTPLQILWMFIVATTLASLPKDEKVKKDSFLKGNTFKVIGLAIVNVGLLYVLYANFRMYVTENYIGADTNGKDLLTSSYVYKYDQARGKFSSLFDITGGGKPVDHYLAMYALSEGNSDLALSHLDRSIKMAPNHYESKGLKAIVYAQRKKNLDSAIYYAKEGFVKYPAIKNNYVILLNAYKEKKDTASYFNTYDAWLSKFPNDISQWKAKAERQFEFYKDETLVLETIKNAIKLNPTDQSLIKYQEKYVSKNRSEDIRKWYKDGFAFIKERNYIKAKQEFLKILEIAPSNGATLLNLGIIEVKMKQYDDAISHLTTLIDGNNFKDGRPEYNRAIAYEKLGNLEMARKDYTKSKKLGYKLAQKLPQSKLNE